MKFLLRLKSWQLFILILSPIFISSFNFIGDILYSFGYLVYTAWIYSVGAIMHSMLPEHLKPRVIYFKISCFTLALTTLLVIFFNPMQNMIENVFFWVLFVCVFVSALYSFIFAARMLESMIEGRVVRFSDSIKAFFGFWFFPIGLWYIQPAVHRVLQKYDTSEKTI